MHIKARCYLRKTFFYFECGFSAIPSRTKNFGLLRVVRGGSGLLVGNWVGLKMLAVPKAGAP